MTSQSYMKFTMTSIFLQMKTILLISNRVMHYRSRIYNAFFDRFQEIGYEFHVISNSYQPVDFPIRYIKHEKPFSITGYIYAIQTIKPEICINFLHLKDKLIIPLTLYCRLKGIPMIYWNHGINLKDPDNKLKNAIFHLIHHISSAIILYTPDQMKHIDRKDLYKTFIAYNTLSFESSDKFRASLPTKGEIKAKYGIKEKYVLLYISRILPYKGLDLLMNYFKDVGNMALVIVGPGISKKQQDIVNETSHYYYLGEKYGNEVDEIYSIGDIFSTPGHIGLAINQAFYWGLPILVLNRVHAPEIYYLEEGVNGFKFEHMEELKEKALYLCKHPEELERLSRAARLTYEQKMTLDKMFDGFNQAIEFVQRMNHK